MDNKLKFIADANLNLSKAGGTYFEVTLETAPRPSHEPTMRFEIVTNNGVDRHLVVPKFETQGATDFGGIVCRLIILARRMNTWIKIDENVVACVTDLCEGKGTYENYDRLQKHKTAQVTRDQTL
jgi:hypothetical protein